MKKIVSIFTVLAFFSLAVLGFAAMNHNDANGSSACLGAISHGLSCQKMSNPFSAADEHITIFKNFSTIILNKFLVALLLLWWLINFNLFGRQKSPAFDQNFNPAVWLSSQDLFVYFWFKKFQHWLSGLEASPTIFKTH